MHFDEEMGFQYLGPGITVLSPSDPRPPTVRFDSIVVLAWQAVAAAALGWAALGSHLQTKIWHFGQAFAT